MRQFPPVLYRGSVKNVRGEVSADEILFEYSDRYSVFDWGEMPDTITDKGRSLSVMGKCFFSYLEKKENWQNLFLKLRKLNRFDENFLDCLENSEQFLNFKNSGITHHANLLAEDVSWDSPYMRVKNVKIIRPLDKNGVYDYTAYASKPVNALVPLEIIFRLSLPPGNSFSKRLESSLRETTLWKDHGLLGNPGFGNLIKPVIDFSTKLENGDRYLSYDEAQLISGLNNVEFDRLKTYAKLIGLSLYVLHQEMGIELLDGKIEVATISSKNENREFLLVDSVGIDELRLVKSGINLSKEFLREHYKKSNWHKALEISKKEASFQGCDFKAICLAKYKEAPEPLDKKTKEKTESLYKSYANELNALVRGRYCFESEFNLQNHLVRFE